MRKRTTAIFAVCTAAAALLFLPVYGHFVKPSASAQAPEQTVLTFWDENPGPSRTPYYEELFRRFESAHPDIKVHYTGIPISFNKQMYDVGISANDMPDLAVVNAEWIADFADKGVLLPLDDYYGKWEERVQIPESYIAYNRSLVPDGRLYQLPGTVYVDILWYRADWFRQAGLRPPQTWDDFFQDVRLLSDSGQDRYGYSIRGASGSITQLTSWMYAYSGLTEYFRADGSCTVNDPLHVEFLKRYAALYGTQTDKSDILNGYKEMVAAFDSGRAAMIGHNFGSLPDHLQALGPDKIGGTLLPPAVNGGRVLVTVANGYSIFKKTSHPAAAWELMKFLLSEESQSYWNSHVRQLPTNRQSLNQDYIRSTPILQEALAAMDSPETSFLQVPYSLPHYTSVIKQQVEPNFQKVLSGTMTVEQFLNDWAAVMERSYAQAHP